MKMYYKLLKVIAVPCLVYMSMVVSAERFFCRNYRHAWRRAMDLFEYDFVLLPNSVLELMRVFLIDWVAPDGTGGIINIQS